MTALNGYEPQLKTTFALIDAVEIVPEFDTINLPDWDGIWDMEQLYAAGEVTFIPQRGAVIIVR